MNKKNLILIVLVIVLGAFCFIFINNMLKSRDDDNNNNVELVGDITIDLIKKSHRNKNYLISPYSIEVALNMLKEGASGKTKEEINNVLDNRNLNISNENVKIANALFIKNMYKDVIERNFTNVLKTKYNSEILYDEFKTPDVINNWVKKNTDGMIEKVINKIDSEFVFGLANAIAIDVKWLNEFECNNTISEKFTKINNKTVDVEMMHKQFKYNAKYLDDDIKGVMLPYKEGLEFIALLPDESLDKYINNLTKEELNKTLDSFKEPSTSTRLNLSIPRFNYEYDLDNFKEILISMGITLAFDSNSADFSSIITKENLQRSGKANIYVSDAVHKTYIDLNEKGTKAAAVTFFGIRASGAYIEDYKIVDIKFDKPFVYMIRDIESKEILFFGSVYEPNKWNGSTCNKE